MNYRESEHRYLNNYYEKQGSAAIVVYGQEGVGKRRFLQEFIADKFAWQYVCRNCEDREQRFQLREELGRLHRADESGNLINNLPQFPAWGELFEAMAQGHDVLVFYHFDHLFAQGSEFLSALGSFLKAHTNGRMLVLLVTDSIRWTENSMLRQMKRNALLLTGLLKIRPLSFYRMRELYPEIDLHDAVIYYSVLGGFPNRWALLDTQKSVENNIIDLFLSPFAPLSLSYHKILSGELRELNVYQTILGYLGNEMRKLNDIHQQTEFSRAKISVYLKNLMQMEVVEKVFSVDTPGRDRTQKGLYRISDPLLAFYFRFVFRHQTDCEVLNDAEEFYNKHIAAFIEDHAGIYFRRICLEYIEREIAAGRINLQVEEAGEWIGKKASLDLLIESDDGEALVGICNFHHEMITEEDLEWLHFACKQARISPTMICLFSMQTFSESVLMKAHQEDQISLFGKEELDG
ncbi:MAG: hypothetical protein K6G23_02140 [Lachnospiraceae bacterium]|nr:hypothetical protein [Lachnospiraceae bacterium]